MATIGLDRLYYAKITEGENGEETYATPTPLAKAISAELSVELAEAILYADDGAAEISPVLLSVLLPVPVSIRPFGHLLPLSDLPGSGPEPCRRLFGLPLTGWLRQPVPPGG